ncbi:MAG: hypothetical protein C4526_08620 [Nitrospiraceae bacterium]|nr:MAG: hypothetical protein C4526_08620 [Nitrospiraceae bacterium]
MKILLLGLGDSPVRSRFIANHCENFIGDIVEHEILTFGYNDGVDIKIGIGDDFSQVFNKLPEGWQPDFCLFWEIEWNLLPEGIEKVPCPTVALISDWDYDIHLSKLYAESFDLVIVIADFEKEALQAIGANKVEVFDRAWAMKEFINASPKAMKDRKYDIVYTTFIDNSLHPERSAWVSRLCGLSDKYNILIENHLPGYKDYMALLGNARLVFSHHRFGSMSGRVFEAGSQGAVVVDTGASVSKLLDPDRDYISVTADNFSSKIEGILSDTKRLQRMSGRIHRKVSGNYEARDHFRRFLKFVDDRLKLERTLSEAVNAEEAENLIKKGTIYYYSYFRTSQGPSIVDGRRRLLLLSAEKFEEAAGPGPSARARTNLAIAKAAYGFLFGRKQFFDSGVDDCIDILKGVTGNCPQYAMAHFNIGLLYLRVGKFSEALDNLKTALQLFKDENSDVDIWCLHNRDYDLFNDFLRKELNDNLFLYCRGDNEKAVKKTRNLYQSFIYYLIALIEEKNRKVYSALEALRKSERLCPDSRLTLTMLVQKLVLLGYKEEGLEMYGKAIGLMPVNIALRLEYIKVLYLYHMDKQAIDEIRILLRTIKTVSRYKNKSSEIKTALDNFTRLKRNPGYSFDPGRENVLNGWLGMLMSCLKKDPKNINLISRIVAILHELGRTGNSLELVSDYTGKYGNELSSKELPALGDLHDHLVKAADEQSNFYAEKLKRINDQLSNVSPL